MRNKVSEDKPGNRPKPEPKRKQNQTLKAENRLFRQLRLSLTGWYGGVLGIALVLFSLVLYFTMQQLLFQPVENSLAEQSQLIAQRWQELSNHGCPQPNSRPNLRLFPLLPSDNKQTVPFYLACFNQDGQFVTDINSFIGLNRVPEPFKDNFLAVSALQQGKTSAIVDGGPGIGALYIHTVVIKEVGDSKAVAVIQVGRSVEDLQTALRVLSILLVVLGGLTLLGTSLGGLLLANRALRPTRLAFARQQTFIADASHELRTPLTILQTEAEILLRGRDRLSEDDAALLQDIVSEAQHLDGLATHLLALARLDAGKVQLEYDVIDLTELARKAMHRIRLLASEKGVTLCQNPDGPLIVIGDWQLLEQVVLILLDNAIKYTPPGGVIKVGTSEADHQMAQVNISDTGIGIAAEHLPYLGERFYRVDKARSREVGGAGLGLALARSIVTLHGGNLKFSSISGEGTTVSLALPTSQLKS